MDGDFRRDRGCKCIWGKIWIPFDGIELFSNWICWARDGSVVKNTLLHLQRTRLQFPATPLGASELPVTLVPRHPLLCSGFHGYLHAHACTPTQKLFLKILLEIGLCKWLHQSLNLPKASGLLTSNVLIVYDVIYISTKIGKTLSSNDNWRNTSNMWDEARHRLSLKRLMWENMESLITLRNLVRHCVKIK